MRRLLLLCVLSHAITLPSIRNPAIWESEERWQVQKRREATFRYAEPFEEYRNGKLDFAWSDGFFLAAAGFGSSSLDSIYRELEFSGFLALKPLSFLSLELGESSNISWVPQDGSWQEHRVSLGLNLFYREWAKLSFYFPWQFACEMNLNSFYSFGAQLSLNEEKPTDFRMHQQINLGHFDIYNSFAYPGPVLGFGFALSLSDFAAALGYLRGSYPQGHLGYLARWQSKH